MALFILLLYNFIVCSLLNQSEEELELLFIEGVLHREHVVITVVKDEVRDTLLTLMYGRPEGGPGCTLRFNFSFLFLMFKANHVTGSSHCFLGIFLPWHISKATKVIGGSSKVVLLLHDISFHRVFVR